MAGTSIEFEDSESLLLAPVREGELVANKYVAGRVLGVGGMGVVLQATDKVLGRKVAIKFLLPSLANSDRAVQRFIREARAAARITSEHVVKLLEIDELPNGTPFFVMEYLDGHDLRAMITERGSLPLARVVDYLLQALEAIAEGHLSGVVHRDLKPGNLFVARRADGTPLVKVLDFGIAKTLELDGADTANLTGSDDTRLGSPAYMSPEQLQNPSEVDARSDIWALGVTLYELVCGSHPFQGQTYADLVLCITTGPFEPPSNRRPDLTLPRGLNDIVMRCLEKDKRRRYSNVAELAAALAPFGGEHARASLKRINGLRISPVASSDYAGTTTTHEAESAEQAGQKPTSSGGVREPKRTHPATGVAIVALVAFGIIGLAWSRRAATLVDRVPSRQTVDAGVRALPRPDAVPVVTSSIEEAIASRSDPVLPDAAVPMARPRFSAAPRAAVNQVITAKHAASEEQPVPPPPTAESSEPLGPRSQLIEKLIEKRR
jgi:serine/threonine-protein kinase